MNDCPFCFGDGLILTNPWTGEGVDCDHQWSTWRNARAAS